MNYVAGRGFDNVFYDSEAASVFLKHQVEVLKGRNGSLIKIYLNDGSLKTPLEQTIKNCEAAYIENPDLIPKTELIATGYITADQKKHHLALIEQEYVEGAENVTLAHYFEEGFDKEATDKVFDKFDIMNERHKMDQKVPNINNYDSFFAHEARYEKRWNAPVASFCLQKLKRDGEKFLIFDKINYYTNPPLVELSKVTREFAPRNLLVDGDKLTFDTELYGIGKAEMDFAVMISQLLNRKGDYASDFIKYIKRRYDDNVPENAMVELIGYRSAELLKDKKGIGDNREEYHREQLQKAVSLWNENF